MTLRLHNTLEWIEEDFDAGRITFREALEAYREVIETDFDGSTAVARAYEEGYDAGYAEARDYYDYEE